MFTATAIGRLVRNPVLEHLPKGTPVAKFRIACDKPRGREGTNYIDIVVWANAEDNHKYLSQGRQVAVTGNINHQQWKTEDGDYRERYELIAEQVTWLAKPANGNGTAEMATTAAATGDEPF